MINPHQEPSPMPADFIREIIEHFTLITANLRMPAICLCIATLLNLAMAIIHIRM